jgi:hypothetical protein
MFLDELSLGGRLHLVEAAVTMERLTVLVFLFQLLEKVVGLSNFILDLLVELVA